MSLSSFILRAPLRPALGPSTCALAPQTRFLHLDVVQCSDRPCYEESGAEARRARLGRTLPQVRSGLDRRIRRVLIPCCLSFLVVPLTNAVDTIWIGQMGSVAALAGQSAAVSVFSTAFFLVSFLPTVMAPLVARAVGEGRLDAARTHIAETMFLVIVVCVCVPATCGVRARVRRGLVLCCPRSCVEATNASRQLASVPREPCRAAPCFRAKSQSTQATLFGLAGVGVMTIFGRQCLLLVLAPASPALPHADAYLRIRALSLLPALWASVGFAALRGAQDTKTPLKIAAASNLLNAALDPLLIFGGLGVRALGVAGAAAATALAEIASGAAYLAILSRRNLMPLRSALARAPSLAQLWPLLSAGGALQFRNLCLNLAFLFATRTAQLADSTGVQAAAYGITMQFWGLGGVLLSALQASAATLMPAERARAAADGRGERAAARETADRLIGWGVVFGLALAALQVAALPLLALFSTVPAVREAAVAPAAVASVMQVINGVVFVGEGIMIGSRSYATLAMQTALGAVAMVCGLCLSATLGGGVIGIWLAILVFNVVQLAGVVAFVYFAAPLNAPDHDSKRDS